MGDGETSAGSPPDILEERVVCEHVSMAERWLLLNLLQLEIKRLNCSPTAPSTTMPERGLKLDRLDMVQAPSGKLRSMEARGLLPRDEACAGGDDSWDLGFSLLSTLSPAPPSRALQATAREVVYGTVGTVMRFQARREDILSRLKRPFSYSKLRARALRRQRFLGHASAAFTFISHQSHPQPSAVIREHKQFKLLLAAGLRLCGCAVTLAIRARSQIPQPVQEPVLARGRLSTRRELSVALGSRAMTSPESQKTVILGGDTQYQIQHESRGRFQAPCHSGARRD